MDALIAQALQLAKLGDKQTAWMQKQETQLTSLIQPLLDDLQFEAKASNIQLVNEACPDIHLTINATSLHSAIENVMRNAIKYASTTVRVSFTEFIQNGESLLKISIEDDGQGIPEQEREQIFQPFYRAQSTAQIKGTGLGLSIAKAAIELHNGHIIAQQSSLGGLLVEMIIPR
jgi:signal transduction histidine kinase